MFFKNIVLFLKILTCMLLSRPFGDSIQRPCDKHLALIQLLYINKEINITGPDKVWGNPTQIYLSPRVHGPGEGGGGWRQWQILGRKRRNHRRKKSRQGKKTKPASHPPPPSVSGSDTGRVLLVLQYRYLGFTSDSHS